MAVREFDKCFKLDVSEVVGICENLQIWSCLFRRGVLNIKHKHPYTWKRSKDQMKSQTNILTLGSEARINLKSHRAPGT